MLSGAGLVLERGRTLGVLGRSGCGKTTLLKVIAGLIEPDRGMIELEGREIGATPPEQRGVVYLYQEPLLFPHMNVRENIAFGLSVRRVAPSEIARRVEEMVEQLGLAGEEGKMPHQLSGGERQRVAFGRAVVVRPPVLLLDEPFGSLDPETRAQMQELFRTVAQRAGVASVFVTHDVKEAIVVGDDLAYMDQGKLVTFPTREDFIHHPQYGAGREIAFWNALAGEKR